MKTKQKKNDFCHSCETTLAVVDVSCVNPFFVSCLSSRIGQSTGPEQSRDAHGLVGYGHLPVHTYIYICVCVCIQRAAETSNLSLCDLYM